MQYIFVKNTKLLLLLNGTVQITLEDKKKLYGFYLKSSGIFIIFSFLSIIKPI